MPPQRPPSAAPKPKPVAHRHADWPGLASGALIAAGTIAVYGRTFSVPLLFDDIGSIADNPSIRRLWPIWPVLSPPNETGVGGRPILNLSYAVNYAAGGTDVFGYHLVNLLVHVLAAWTLFALVRHTLLRPPLAKRFGSAATPLALAVGAIWAWHPVQTESVTYLSQRAESLMGLFYLLTLYCFVRGAETADQARNGRRIWFSLSVLACLAGVGTKEVIATVPIMALLYDRTFLSGSFSAAWRRHRPVYLGLAATWVPLGCFMIGLTRRGVGFGQGVAGWAYGLTECRVIVKYLLLVFWPRPLVFDYGAYVAARPSEIVPYIFVLASLLTVTVVALRKSPAAGFAACWFFLILAPASSIIPVFTQPMAENRLYLSLAGMAALAVLGAFSLAGRWSLAVLAVIAAGLGVASFQRNRDYASELDLWSDTVAKNPANPRAHTDLGNALAKMPGRSNEAIAQFEEALRLQPDLAEAHNNLGDTLTKIPGRLNDAIAHLKEALRLKPDYAEAHNNMGNAWLKIPGRLNDAVAEYGEALRLKPGFAEAHNNLGDALSEIPGRLNDAVAEYEEALRLQPDYAGACYNLGKVWVKIPERLNDGISQLEKAVSLKPDFAEAHCELGSAWAEIPGRLNDAIAEYGEALRLKPDFAEAHNNLGLALSHEPGRLDDAIAEYEEAVRLKPNFIEAHDNLGGVLLHQPGRLDDGIAQFEEVVRLNPDFAEAHYNLGTVLSHQPGRLEDAVTQFEEAVRLKPELVQAQFNLAVALFQLPGRGEEAKAHLATVLRLQPDNDRARRLMARIQPAQF